MNSNEGEWLVCHTATGRYLSNRAGELFTSDINKARRYKTKEEAVHLCMDDERAVNIKDVTK